MKKFIIGSYVASLSLRQWHPENETAFYSALKARPQIGGIEHGFYGNLHRYDDTWFLKNIAPAWDFVFTCIPGTMERLEKNPLFGLASPNEDGRCAAVDFIHAARDAVSRLNTHLGRKAVLAVTLHSAPSLKASPDCFYQSLSEISTWDWDGAELHIEHCDAQHVGGSYAKGFLRLEDELSVIEKVNNGQSQNRFGIMLNWGRSVIEGQSTETILDHIKACKSKNLLRGFIFSGTTDKKDSPYEYFGDKHAPAPTPHNGEILVPESLMTEAEIKKSLALLPDTLHYLGLKVMPRPVDADFKRSMVLIDHLLQVLDF